MFSNLSQTNREEKPVPLAIEPTSTLEVSGIEPTELSANTLGNSSEDNTNEDDYDPSGMTTEEDEDDELIEDVNTLRNISLLEL